MLQDGARHTTSLTDPAKYEVTRFGEFITGLDPNAVFPPTEILKGDNEMTVPELRARVGRAAGGGALAARPDHGAAPEVRDSRSCASPSR